MRYFVQKTTSYFARFFITMLTLSENDILEMKKKHPCGNTKFRVLYLGSDIKVMCLGCGREMILPRIKLEKSIKKVITND